jgi:L-iditol 2-dehydrogenase
MRTVQLLGNAKVRVREIPTPQPPKGTVLVQVMASGVCKSEFGAYRGKQKKESNEGHEVAGIIVDARGSRRWRNGDRVGVHAVWGCGRCTWCNAGKYTYCPDRLIMERGHSQFVLAPDHAICRLPEDCPYDVGVLLTGCTMGHAFHCQNLLRSEPGEFVMVVGLGPTGLSQTLMQSWVGAEVIAVDVIEERLTLARELGAAHTVSSKNLDPVAAVKEITRGRLANRAIECVGQPDAIELALKCVGPGGRVLCSGEQGIVPIAINNDLIRRDITLLGTWYYHYCEYPSLVESFNSGLSPGKLITHRFKLGDAASAFREYEAGHTGKIIFEPSN